MSTNETALDRPSKQAYEAYLLLAFTALCWGGNAVLGRVAVGEISPMALVAARWLGVLLLAVLFLRKGLIRDWPVLRRHWLFIVLMGASGFTIFNALFYIAAHHTTAINIGIVQGSIPIFVMLGTMNLISLLVSYRQILDPYDGANQLFVASIPVAAASLVLFLLRDRDTWLTVARQTNHGEALRSAD